MKRCNKPATFYSWFNGFRACKAHIETGKPHEYDAMVNVHEPCGPCDVPIETREEFFSRYPESRFYKRMKREEA